MLNLKNKTMNEDIFIEEKRTIKLPNNVKLMNRVYSDYTEDQIKRMLNSYLGEDNYNYTLKISVGDTINTKIIGETKDDYLFDIGYKDYLRVDKNKNETLALAKYANNEGTVNYDTEIEIQITKFSENPYTIKGSIAALQKSNTYSDMLNNANEPIEATVLSWIPAGFTLELRYDGYKIPAFMPNILSGVNKLSPEQSQELVGKILNVMIESYSSEKGTFIASRKKYLQSLIPNEIENLKNYDENGKPVEYIGVVTGTIKFGIFVEFNSCLTGMIHKDNLNDEYKNIFTSLASGTEIKFYIKEIIKNKLILTQVWKETIWDVVDRGQEYIGEVLSEKSFGILVRLDEETVGLIHNSELEKFDKKPIIGTKIKVKVIFAQKMERKIYLTLSK